MTKRTLNSVRIGAAIITFCLGLLLVSGAHAMGKEYTGGTVAVFFAQEFCDTPDAHTLMMRAPDGETYTLVLPDQCVAAGEIVKVPVNMVYLADTYTIYATFANGEEMTPHFIFPLQLN